MPLSAEEIQRLLSAPEKRSSGKGKSKSIDTSTRDYITWFKLAHKLFDEENHERIKCENSSCTDPRPGRDHGTVVAEVNGKFMCRYCFMNSWLADQPQQLVL